MTQMVWPDHAPFKHEENVHIPIFQTQERIVQNPVDGQEGLVDQRGMEAPWVRSVSAELARNRLAHLRGIYAAPASVRSMVSRKAGHSSSEEEDKMEMEVEKEMIAVELVFNNFTEELSMLAKTKGNPSTSQKPKRLVAMTAKRLGMTAKDLMACVKMKDGGVPKHV